jgi:hypothetical protein
MPIVKPKLGITPELIRKVLTYFPDEGRFIWNDRDDIHWSVNRRFSGKEAGCINNKLGYRVIRIKNVLLQASIVAWLYQTGEWPSLEIDHKNQIKDDDRWQNLRLATHSQNNANKRAQSNNISGYLGVSRTKNKWFSRIVCKGKSYYLGVFDDEESAYEAYRRKKIELFGEFGS